jgi:hypothetical protein
MSLVLNPDQQKAKEFFSRWWNSDRRYAILEGVAGTGKTTIVNELVKDLKNCDPLFTAATNEACKQLEIALPSKAIIRTTYSALGFNFNTSEESRTLQQGGLSKIIDDVNLIIVDECSMIGQKLLDALEETDKKILFIGHRSQLPEVVKNLSVFDDCQSVVFKQDFPIYTLTTPERNKGELFEFISGLEKLIYYNPRIIPRKYSENSEYLLDYIHSKEGKHELLVEDAKIICWSNAEVDKFNKEARKSIFGKSDLPDFVLRDRIVLTEPVSFVEPLGGMTKNQVGSLLGSDESKTFSANTKGIVRAVRQVSVLNIPCWELEIEVGKDRPCIYVPISAEKLEMLRNGLKQECYGYTTKQARDKAWRRYHFLMSCFAKVKHSYAITTHRSQGMTIPKVFVNWSDIRKCQNVYMKHKLLYVAASRVQSDLKIIV